MKEQHWGPARRPRTRCLPGGSDRAAHRPRPSGSCRVFRVVPCIRTGTNPAHAGRGHAGCCAFPSHRSSWPRPSPCGCAWMCPALRAAGLARALPYYRSGCRCRSASPAIGPSSARRADGCRNHRAAIPAEPSPLGVIPPCAGEISDTGGPSGLLRTSPGQRKIEPRTRVAAARRTWPHLRSSKRRPGGGPENGEGQDQGERDRVVPCI
jgi:hypothetical protein